MAQDLQRLAVRRGRQLALSPCWGRDAPSALFDRNSGDYWIVGEAARYIVGALLDASAAPGVARDISIAELSTFPWSDEEIMAVGTELVASGILESKSCPPDASGRHR